MTPLTSRTNEASSSIFLSEAMVLNERKSSIQQSREKRCKPLFKSKTVLNCDKLPHSKQYPRWPWQSNSIGCHKVPQSRRFHAWKGNL